MDSHKTPHFTSRPTSLSFPFLSFLLQKTVKRTTFTPTQTTQPHLTIFKIQGIKKEEKKKKLEEDDESNDRMIE